MARYLDPRNDLVFKRVFGENPDLAMSFLNALLPLPDDRQIEELKYLSAEIVPMDPLAKKNSIVDVRCTDNTGRQFIVEMQMFWTNAFVKRMVFNTSKAYVAQLSTGEDYSNLKPVYALAILNEVFDNKTENFYHRYEILDQRNNQEKIEDMEFVFVELPKFKPVTVSDRKMTVLWLRFLNETRNNTEIAPELTANSEISKALKICEESAFTDAERLKYDRFWDAISTEKTLMSGRFEEGIKKGRVEGKAELILNAFNKGKTPQQISEFIDIPLDIVLGILEQQGKNN